MKPAYKFKNFSRFKTIIEPGKILMDPSRLSLDQLTFIENPRDPSQVLRLRS